MDELTGAAIPALEAALRFRVTRQGVLAANVANLDTPGYRRMDVRFDQALAEAGARLDRSHPRHLPHGPGGDRAYRVEVGARGTRPDGNGLDADRKILELSRNASAFGRQAEVLSRLLSMARVAVTGEAR